jgi:hypothetical protein
VTCSAAFALIQVDRIESAEESIFEGHTTIGRRIKPMNGFGM